MNNILEVEALTKRYKASDFTLRDVSFALPYGSIMGFIGENGAGKTTAINCILNTVRRDSGAVRLFGREMTDESTAIREDLGVVFDAGNFSGQLTPKRLSQVMRGVFSRWDDALYHNYLQKFRLPASKAIKTFSRGMSMKLSIAAALSHHPKLLILDEATSGLDPIVRDEILDVFLDFIQDEGRSILLSSHITSDLEKIADYITVIHDGKIILTAKKDDLIYNYAVARCKAEQYAQVEPADVIAHRRRDYQIDVLLRDKKQAWRKYKGMVVDDVSLDDILLLLVKGERV